MKVAGLLEDGDATVLLLEDGVLSQCTADAPPTTLQSSLSDPQNPAASILATASVCTSAVPGGIALRQAPLNSCCAGRVLVVLLCDLSASVPLFSVGWVRSHREPLQVLARFEAECDRAIRPQQLTAIIIDGPAVTVA